MQIENSATRITVWHHLASTSQPLKIIRIFNGCEVRIENSIMRITIRHHSASTSQPLKIIRIFYGCEVRIENFATRITVWHHSASTSQPLKIIRIFYGCEVRIENSATRITVWHHSASTSQPLKIIRISWRKLWSLATQWAHSEDSWSDWADAQADLSLRWAHIRFVGFFMSRLIWTDRSEQTTMQTQIRLLW